MASRRRTPRANGHDLAVPGNHHYRSKPQPPASRNTHQPSAARSPTHLFPLPPPYGKPAASSFSIASSSFSIAVANQADDEVSDLLNGSLLHPSEPATPQRASSLRHLSSPLTLSHFDHSPIRTQASLRAPSSPAPFPASLAASSSSSSHTAPPLLLVALEQWRLHLLRSTFHDWLLHTTRRSLLHAAFNRWRRHKTAAKQTRTKTLHALQHWSHTHQRTAFAHWHAITTQPLAATAAYRTALSHAAFRGWLGWVRRRKWLYGVGHAVVDGGERRVKGEVVGWWVGQVRQRMAADGWRVQRAATTAIERWRQRVVAVRWRRQQMEGAGQLKAEWETKRVRSAVARWHLFATQRRVSGMQADKADHHWQGRAFRMWQSQVPSDNEQRMAQKQQRARRFHSTQLLKKVLTSWHGDCSLLRRQGEQLQQQQQTRRLNEALLSWLSLLRETLTRTAEQQRAAAEMQASRDTWSFSTLFHHWLRLTRSLIFDSQRLSLADEHNRSSVLVSTLSAWSLFSRRRRHAKALTAAAATRHSGRLLSGAWLLWSASYRRSIAVARVRMTTRRRTLDDAFGHWRDTVLCKRIVVARQNREESALRHAVTRWRQTTNRTVDMAISFSHFRGGDRERSRRAAFVHWRTFYLIHRQRRLWLLRISFNGWVHELEERRDERALLRHVVLQWGAEANKCRQQRLLSVRLHRRCALLPAVIALQQHASYRKSRREKAQIASSHYHHTITSHTHHTRYLRTAYLAWYYYTRHRRQLLQLSDTLQQRQARVLLSSVLSAWHQQSEQLRLADEWRRRYAQAQTLADWRQWTTQQAEERQLSDALQRLWQQKQQERVRSALNRWYEWCSERRVDSAQQRMARVFHLRQLTMGWKRCVPADERLRTKAKQKAADLLNDSLAVRRAWRAWILEGVRRRQERLHLAAQWQAQQSSGRLRLLWNKWRQRLSFNVLWNATAQQKLQTHQSTLLKHLYGLWRESFTQRRDEKTNWVKADRLHHSSAVRRSCRRWRAVCADAVQRQKAGHQIVASRRVLGLRAAMATWLHHARLSQAAAVLSAHAAQLQMQAAFSQWSEMLLIERAQTFLQQRQLLQLTSSLTAWRVNSHALQQQRQSEEQLQRLVSSHRTSAAFHAWASLFQRRRHLAALSSAVTSLHNRLTMRVLFSAWTQQKRIHHHMRLHALRSAFRAWRVERKKNNADRKQLAVVVRRWRTAAQREKEIESASRHLLRVRTLRCIMDAWQSSRLAHHVFVHWRKRATEILSTSSQLQMATADHQRRQKQLAVRSLRQHAQQSHHNALLNQHLTLSHQSHLIRLALSVWIQRWREVHAVSALAAIAARQQQTAAWERWQEAVWDEKGRCFQQELLLRSVSATLHCWTASHRQQQHEASLTAQCHAITARLLLGDSFRHLLACFHLTCYQRSLEAASAAQHTGRVSREVFAWWYNVSVIRRHMRAARLRGVWQVWRRHAAAAIVQREAVVGAFRSWRDAAAHSKQCMQRAAFAYRQTHLIAFLAALSTAAQGKIRNRTLASQAEQLYRGRLQQHVWRLWQQQQQLAMTCRAQLELAARYSEATMCSNAVVRWRQWRLNARERTNANAAALRTMEESKRRRVVHRWHSTAQQQRVVRSVQQLSTRPVLREWRLTTAAVRAERRQLLHHAWLQWTTARHDLHQEGKVRQARQQRAQRICGRIVRAWTALSGTHAQVRQTGEKLRGVRRARQLRALFGTMQSIAAVSSVRLRQDEDAAFNLYRRHHLRRLWAEWKQLATSESALQAARNARAEHYCATAMQRRVMDVWEEQTSAALRQRHTAAAQSARLTIALRSYHTSLLLHTFSIWRAAHLSAHWYPSPRRSHRSAVSASDAATANSPPPPRLSSISDLRAYMEQTRVAGRVAGGGGRLAPRSPLSAATTETDGGSYAPSEASRPSTNGSVRDERADRAAVEGAKRALAGMRRGGGISRIDMRDL